ncbi:hypothetical protein SCARR_00851 [Pontiella sulfatireligans]|uniref:SAP domain-containing protein n=2 Tax=Pontiella sulfatireligans TaxID=2750658 RepID=A0A6C2UFA8_9BACT|nr:hypothetical protein SCARR_00851 [Pontiella sulfatireligans]
MGLTGDWCQAAELLARSLNRADRRFPELSPQRLNYDIIAVRDNPLYDKRPALERTLEQVARDVYFVEGVSFDSAVKQAKAFLTRRWTQEKAWALLSDGRNGFSEMRAFLKVKHPKLKIGSYDAMRDLDLTALLSVEDFAAEEQALLHAGLECRNFRQPQAVTDQLDDHNRLRFTDRINWFELVINPGQAHTGGHVKYGCELKGSTVHFKPELSNVVQQRRIAKAIARQYRTEGGDYCFSMPIGRLQEILDREQVALRFSNVRYLERIKPVTTSARLRKEEIPKFGITWRKMETADEFRDALRAHGWKVAGKKSDLVRRTAELASERLEEAAPELDAWFVEHRYVRVPKGQTFPTPFPVLADEPLKELVLMVYLMRRLRGNTVVDPGHENTSVRPVDMAEAILNGKTALTGSFLKA